MEYYISRSLAQIIEKDCSHVSVEKTGGINADDFLKNLQSRVDSHSGKLDAVLADRVISSHELTSSEQVSALLTGILSLLKPEGILILRENLGEGKFLNRRKTL